MLSGTVIFPQKTSQTKDSSPDLGDLSRPNLKVFSDKNGLPVNTVMTLERDQRGYLWIGTQDGAVYYNGNKLTVVNMPNPTVSNYIYDILASPDGKLWFGTGGGGVHVLSDGQWQTYRKKDGLISDAIRAFLQTFGSNGEPIIWIGTRDGLSKFSNGAWTNFDDRTGLPENRVRSLLETTESDGTQTLWIGTYGGLAVWRPDGEKKVFDINSGLPGNIIYCLLKTQNKNGSEIVWAGTDKGLAKREDGVWKVFGDQSEILTHPVRSLHESVKSDGTKTLWVGFGNDGLAYLENSEWHFLNEKQGLPNNLVFAFADSGAPDGSVWISTLGAGLARFDRSNWRSLDEKVGLANKLVFGISETRSSESGETFWFGTYGDGITRFENGGWKTFTVRDGLPNDFTHCMYVWEKAEGGQILYVGTESGLARWENGRFQNIPLITKAPFNEVWKIGETFSENGKRALLVGTNGGLIRIIDGEQRVFTKEDGLPDIRIRTFLETIAPDGKKTLWVGTYGGGLAKFDGEKWTVLNGEKGLPNNRVYCLKEIESEGVRQLWIGTGGGIAILNLDSEKSDLLILSTESGHLPNDSVNQIFTDIQKRIYVTTNKGVARITPNPDSSDARNYETYIFTTEDGLPSNETIAGSSFTDSRNRLWIGTVSGLALLDVSQEFPDTDPDPLFLERVLIDGREEKLPPDTELAYYKNNLVFEFAMPAGFRESATVYRTQMVNLEEKPTDWTREPRREFSYVPPGDFIFRVWGKDASGNISGPIEIPFSVRPAWWQTWWAFALYLLGAAGLATLIAFAVYRNRLQRMLELERVRTRIATDLHDDIGASLSQISILSEILAGENNHREEEEKRSLKIIAETSRELTSSMSDVIWAINPKRDHLRDLIRRMRRFASDILTAKDIDFSFQVPSTELDQRLDVDIRQQVYLVFKESVNNAVKHSECTRIDIEFKTDGNNFTLSVRDNGRGFEIEEDPDGNGLLSMRWRAENVGGKLVIESRPGQGTNIRLSVPLKKPLNIGR
ncbi:MAG: two-component regulator propeller domain-containing protein [Pyrinomonadaceae bacterium]